MSLQLHERSLTNTLPIDMAAAATKAMVDVLDDPELAEKILFHIAPPSKFFALRRVHPAFKAAIADSRHTRQRMLLEYADRVSILKLNAMLYDKFLSRAIHPFSITQVHVQTATKTLYIALTLDRHWFRNHWRCDDTETLLHATQNGSGSWKDMRIEHPKMKVAVTLDIPPFEGVYGTFFQTVRTFGADEDVDVDTLVGVAVRVSVAVNLGDKEHGKRWLERHQVRDT